VPEPDASQIWPRAGPVALMGGSPEEMQPDSSVIVGGDTMKEPAEETASMAEHAPSQIRGVSNGCPLEPPGQAPVLADNCVGRAHLAVDGEHAHGAHMMEGSVSAKPEVASHVSAGQAGGVVVDGPIQTWKEAVQVPSLGTGGAQTP
jgi:hypothetical protein